MNVLRNTILITLLLFHFIYFLITTCRFDQTVGNVKGMGARSTSTAIFAFVRRFMFFTPLPKSKNEIDRFNNFPRARDPFKRQHALTSSDFYLELPRGLPPKICTRKCVESPSPRLRTPKNKLIQTLQESQPFERLCALIGHFNRNACEDANPSIKTN
jgi:hypothetical protein